MGDTCDSRGRFCSGLVWSREAVQGMSHEDVSISPEFETDKFASSLIHHEGAHAEGGGYDD